MKTPLQIRPLAIRLRIAYMATKNMILEECDLGNTLGRLNSYECGEFRHPYASVWQSVKAWYSHHNLGNMSDQAINKMYTSKLASDKKLSKCVDQWEALGWTEYEHRRDGRRRAVRKFAMPILVIGGAFLGINLPEVDA